MPGTRCTVAVCNNSFEKTKRSGMNIMYHQFPKTQPFRNMWIERCRRAGKWNPNSCHICSIHFQEDDYRKETSYESLNLPGKRRLKPTAVPSLFLNEAPPLTLVTLTQRKEKLETPKMEQFSCLDNDNAIYMESDDLNTLNKFSNLLQTYETRREENSHDEMSSPEYENESINVSSVDDLKLYCTREKNDKMGEIDEEYSNEPKPLFIMLHDSSTQTDTDYFLENYNQLVKRNENLENELVRWGIRYQKLLSNTRRLESELERLKLYSKQMQQ